MGVRACFYQQALLCCCDLSHREEADGRPGQESSFFVAFLSEFLLACRVSRWTAHENGRACFDMAFQLTLRAWLVSWCCSMSQIGRATLLFAPKTCV